jgi:1-acyl-sn-glycerol-3-phosphate acyltransferase
MRSLRARVYTVACWIGCALSTALWGTVSLAASLVSSRGNLQHACMRRWSRDNLWLSRARVEIEGLEHVDAGRPQLYVANHSGLHDILALAAHLPIQFRWLAKKSLFSVPFMGWHMTRSGYIPVDRENPRDAARSLAEAARIVASGASAIAFPEGTRSRTGELGAFRSGAFALALRAGVPVVPIAIEGSHRVIQPKTLAVHPGTVVRIRIAAPLDPARYGRGEKARLMADARDVIEQGLAALRARRRPGEENDDPVHRWIHGGERGAGG